MKYQITFYAIKEIDDWDPENGASGKNRGVDQWQKTVMSNVKPTRTDFADFVYDRYSLKANQFRHWPDEPNRFTMNRIENNDGEEDENGRYLADYDVRVVCVRTMPEENVGTFGLKSVDQ